MGPQEFVQCNSNLNKEPLEYDRPSTSGLAPGVQDSKKTCNLETYYDWSGRLRLLVANEILQVNSYLFNVQCSIILQFFSYDVVSQAENEINGLINLSCLYSSFHPLHFHEKIMKSLN